MIDSFPGAIVWRDVIEPESRAFERTLEIVSRITLLPRYFAFLLSEAAYLARNSWSQACMIDHGFLQV